MIRHGKLLRGRKLSPLSFAHEHIWPGGGMEYLSLARARMTLVTISASVTVLACADEAEVVAMTRLRPARRPAKASPPLRRSMTIGR